MFCKHCGQQIADDSVFCGFCGKSVGEELQDFDNDDALPLIEEQELAEESVYSEEENSTDCGYGENQYGYEPQPEYYEPQPQYYEAQPDYYNNGVQYGQPAPVKKKKNGLVIGLVIAAVMAVIAVAAVIIALVGGASKPEISIGNGSTGSSTVVEDDDDYAAEEDENLISGNTKILDAYEEGSVFAPEILYNDADYYISCNIGALYKESGGYGRGQIAQLDCNDVVTVKGAMEGSNWVYVYCEELDIYGWIEQTNIAPSAVDEFMAKTDQREVIYHSSSNCYDAVVDVGKGHNLNMRNIPSSLDDSTVVRLIPDGERVKVIGVSAIDVTWYYVCYNSYDYGNIYGFMSGEYLERQ